MATDYKLNALLSLPEEFDITTLEIGEQYSINKDGFRIMPVEIPMELSTWEHVYIAKIIVNELIINNTGTFIKFTVLKMFTSEESEVYTKNFIPKDK